MKGWALAGSVGPVGAFIAAGRRSRDLWWGSTWASECTLAAASRLAEGQPGIDVTLILPTEERMKELSASPRSDRYSKRISNRLLARVSAGSADEIRGLAEASALAAQRHLERRIRDAVDKTGEGTSRKARAIEFLLDKSALKAQLDAILDGDFVETYFAWTPWPKDEAHPKDDETPVQRAHRLLDALKSARLFDAPRWSEPGRRRSDLDPGRDSVFKPTPDPPAGSRRGPSPEARLHRRRLGIGADEGLDAVALGRRLALFGEGEPQLGALPFPPLSRVTFDPWLEAAGRPETRRWLDATKAVLDEASHRGDETFHLWCSPARDPERPIERSIPGHGRFRYDASFLMEGGLAALERELDRARGADEDEIERAQQDLRRLSNPVRSLHERLGAPPPYFALVMMDGDGVGNRLASLTKADELVGLAERLYAFADEAETIVSENGHGCAFFVGGDELAAYLPLDRALGTLLELAKTFSTHLGDDGLTLSAGVAIGHLKADLRATRAAAHDALDKAKARRREALEKGDAASDEGWLEIRELPRSGEARRCTGPIPTICRDLREWQALLLEDRLSLRTPSILHELVLRFSTEDGDGGDLGLDLARGRIRSQWSRSTKEPVSERLDERLTSASSWEALFRLAHEIAIAGRIAKVHALRTGARGGKGVAR